VSIKGDDWTEQKFVDLMQEKFGVRIQFLEEILTKPDTVRGVKVEGTGGRSDLFFAVHSEDVGKFAVPRLMAGIRWIEDVLARGNGGARLYPTRVKEYKCW
jgi:hypothetical protein